MDFSIPFSEFWLRYLEAHRKPGTRAAHYAATAVGVASTAAAIHLGEPLYMLGGIALSYAIAVASHSIIERNQPLIRVNAAYGAIADLKMCWLALTGRLAADVCQSPAQLRLSPHTHLPRRSTTPARSRSFHRVLDHPPLITCRRIETRPLSIDPAESVDLTAIS